jgi:cold shock CspA family protein
MTGEDDQTGTITNVVRDRGFGFIIDDNGLNRFFHLAELRGWAFEDVQVGDKVIFMPEASPRGPRAVAVRQIWTP